MAPEKNLRKRLKYAKKHLILGEKCKKVSSVPTGYVSLYGAERNFGISFEVCSSVYFYVKYFSFFQNFTSDELELIVYGNCRGQFGYFVPPMVRKIKHQYRQYF